MRTLKSVSVVLLFSGLVGCANMKSYSMPLTPREGKSMTPALVSAAQAASLEAWRTQQGGAVAVLEDGTMLSWQTSADERDFILLVQLPGKTQENERPAAFEAAKKRADAIWQAAMQSRASMLPYTPVTTVAPSAM